MKKMSLEFIGMASLILFFSFNITVAVSAVSDAPGKFGGTMRIATIEDVAMWDIHRTSSPLVRYIVQHFAEGLFTEDKDFNPVPMLAEGYTTNAEKTVYTINLRRDVLFHNGKEMTAEDVVASLNRWGGYGPLGTGLFKFVKNVEAVNAYTVRINLKSPCGIILTSLATQRQGAFIFPKEVIQKVGTGYLKPEPDQLIGTGPYRFKEFKPDQYASFVRFDKYNARKEPSSGYSGRRIAYLDELRFIPVLDSAVRAAGIETGEFHHAFGISLRDYERLSRKSDLRMVLGPPWYAAIDFNLNKGRSVMEDIKLRKAIQVGLDIGKIMKGAVGVDKFYRLDPSVMWKETAYWTDVGKPYYNLHDIQKARQLVKESGYRGESIRWYSSRDYPVLYDASVAAVSQLREIGLNVDHRVVDWGAMTKIRTDPSLWDVLVVMVSYRNEPTESVLHSPTWVAGYIDPEKDALLEELYKENEYKKRYAIWEKIEKLFYEKAAWIKLGDYFTLDVQRTSVKGYMGLPEQYFLNTWLEEK